MKQLFPYTTPHSCIRFASNEALKAVKNTEVSDKRKAVDKIAELPNPGAVGGNRPVVKILLDLQSNFPGDFDDHVTSLLCTQILKTFPSNPTVILPTARLCIGAHKRGLVSDLRPIKCMLDTLIPELHSIPNIYMSRTVRAASALEFGDLIETLITEASRPVRVSSYSAMDLSELIHSVPTMRMKCMGSEQRDTTMKFLTNLLDELSSRRYSLKITNEISSFAHVRSAKAQELSFIAVSNILFTLRDVDASGCRSVLRDLLMSRESTDDDAFRGATRFHLISVCDSLLVNGKSSDDEADWKVFKRILKELDRKSKTANEQNEYIHGCIQRLIARYGRKSRLLGFIS
jgi:hypothetical protein